jgi:hypothetical protein
VDSLGLRGFINQFPANVALQFMVFEITLHQPGTKKKVFCCFSGGRLSGGTVEATPIGMAALLQLALIPPKGEHFPRYVTLRNGKTPVKEQIMEALRKVPEGVRICFLGDMQGKLDGQILPAIRFTGKMLRLSSCPPIPRKN